MAVRSHYEVLGLMPSASTIVIKASYKALVLIHHPDKTLGLSPDERADHSRVFRDIQEAYDILGDPKLKAKYDAELKRHDNKVDAERSTFHAYPASPRSSPPKPTRRPSVKLTTPEEKRAIKAKIDQQMAQIQEDQERRDAEEASMSINDLKFTLQIWKDLADEHRDVPIQRATIQIRIYEYEQKVRNRELQHEDWLSNLAKPRGRASATEPSNTSPPSTPTPKPNPTHTGTPMRNTTLPRTFTPALKPTTNPASRKQQQAEQRKREEEARSARANARLQEKSRLEAEKRSRAEAKAAAVRAEKEKTGRLVEQALRKKAEHIAKVRAKVAPAAARATSESRSEDGGDTAKAGVKKTCGKCGDVHASLIEWKKCSMKAAKDAADDEQFFLTV